MIVVFRTRKTLMYLISSRVQVDGYLARKYNMGSVLGSILDLAADKALMATLVVTLTIRGLVPRTLTHPSSLYSPPPDRLGLIGFAVPLGIIILGRDVLLTLSAFWIRWKTLPSPVSCALNTMHECPVTECSFEENLPTLLGLFASFRGS